MQDLPEPPSVNATDEQIADNQPPRNITLRRWETIKNNDDIRIIEMSIEDFLYLDFPIGNALVRIAKESDTKGNLIGIQIRGLPRNFTVHWLGNTITIRVK